MTNLNLETCERQTCVRCVCRVPVATTNEAGVCESCISEELSAPRLAAFKVRWDAAVKAKAEREAAV